VNKRTPAEERRARELAKLDEDAAKGLADMRLTFRRLLLGASCAIAAALLVVVILEANKPRPRAPGPAKPVTVEILPSRP
jgi:hypothetical protein